MNVLVAIGRSLGLTLLLLVAGCATVPGPPITPGVDTTADADPRAAWARVLARHVDDIGRVDFEGLARDRGDLDRFITWVYRTGPNNRPELFPSRDHVLAYHLNAYNALAMYNVLEVGVPYTLAGLRKVGFFLLRRLRIGGALTSLYAYENEVIRALHEPRVHFALNCMAVSCPRLPREPFAAEHLDAQLEREARHFFSESRNVRIDHAARTLHLSEILDFYTGDFLAHAESLTAYVNRYRTPVPVDYAVKFIPYDWTINRQP